MVARYRYLCQAAASHPRWREKWALYKARTVACRLFRSDEALRRLDKVMAAGMQQSFAMSYVLARSDSEWAEISSRIDEEVRQEGEGGAEAQQ
jgi:hypothetical protein